MPEFATAFKIDMPEAYRYLVRYGGFGFLSNHWWALHTDNKLRLCRIFMTYAAKMEAIYDESISRKLYRYLAY
ncbi:MAG: DUF3791 domain-containing protein [Prevotellaceae bacterium]|nr:DUF3791 domain-containing protein [Prevotellaceae bacterium]